MFKKRNLFWKLKIWGQVWKIKFSNLVIDLLVIIDGTGTLSL
jgi:hypothetical protein